MGFKVDTSFLRFLTMGARGVHRVCEELDALGFKPIELERYCGSNKIWATKVKRLRLPDLLCVKTGLRLEVRAKSDLKIRMSDAPNNPDRVWDVGLEDEDLVALIACSDGPDGSIPSEHAVYFTIESLRKSVKHSKLGVPKSASEGAERDRTWPATVPSRPGKVISVNTDKLVVMMEGDENPPRKQTYTLNGKYTYVTPEDKFVAGVTILAGAPDSRADLLSYLGRTYDPLKAISSSNVVDRYSGVKAIRFRPDIQAKATPLLEKLLDEEEEKRVALEAAGSATALSSDKGKAFITSIVWGDGSSDLSMEAILILTELGTPFAKQQLIEAATSEQFKNDERKQAAIWGLGKAGLQAYDDLIPFIADKEENVAFHAIAGFGSNTPKSVIEKLVHILFSEDKQTAPAASEALRVIGSPMALECLVKAAKTVPQGQNWVLATIGRLPPKIVKEHLKDTDILNRLAPMLLVSENTNWLSTESAMSDLAFLLKQNL